MPTWSRQSLWLVSRFEKTGVSLIVDPAADGNNHLFAARGTFGEIFTKIRSTTLPPNPKTSILAPFSPIQTIKKRAGLILAWPSPLRLARKPRSQI